VFNEEFSAPLYRIKVIFAFLKVAVVWCGQVNNLNCCCSLPGECDSDEGDRRRKHKYHRASFSGSAVSGALALYTKLLTN
jgi:hypothetical protein